MFPWKFELFAFQKPFRICSVDGTADKVPYEMIHYTCEKQISANFKIIMMKEVVIHFPFSLTETTC